MLFTSSTSTDLLVIIAAFFAATIVYIKWSFGYWKRKGVPTLTPSIPFGNAGDLFTLRSTLSEVFKRAYDTLKPMGHKYCGFYMGLKPFLLVFDPELIRTITTKDFPHFTDHGNYINEEVDPLTGNLFALKGLRWKKLRAKLTPTFTSGKMKMMFQTFVDCSGQLTATMGEISEHGKPVDIKETVARYTTDVIGSCAFGLECNSLANPDAEFRKYGKKIFERRAMDALKIFLSLSYPAVLDFFRIPITRLEVTRFFTGAVRSTVEHREAHNIVRKDFMHLLIQLKNNVRIQEGEDVGQLKNDENEEGKQLSLAELTAQAFVFFAAGFETSSTTLTFCFFELASNPDIQEKLREEVRDVLERYGGEITYAAVTEMGYMEKCVNETLRKYPPLPVLLRECTKTYKIPETDVIIDKGTMTFVPILAIQRDPEHYPDPERFDPERFSPESKAKRHNYTWLPFGEGPRSCIGMRFGLMQTKVALAALLNKYRFSINSKTRLPLALEPKSFIMSVEGSVWLSVEKI